MERYTGLEKALNYKSILNGDDLTGVKKSQQYNKVYQLGWQAGIFFKKTGNGFEGFNCIHYGGFSKNDPQGDICQVVTRGVNTCTAIAIMRGEAMCLLHLDAHNLINPNGAAIIDKIKKHLMTGSGKAYLVASIIKGSDELKFVQELESMCKMEEFNPSIYYIERGEVPNHCSHIEFGVAIEETGVEVYGDRYSGQQNSLVSFNIPFGIWDSGK